MSFKGLTSAVLLITLIGMALGILITNELSNPLPEQRPSNAPETQRTVVSTPTTNSLPKVQGVGSEQMVSFNESIGSGAGHQDPSEAQAPGEDPLEQAALEELEARLPTWELELQERESELRKSERSLQEWEARLVKQADSLQATEDYLTEQLAALQKERDRLTQEWADLRTKQAHFDDAWTHLQEAQNVLWAKEADVTKREYEAQNLWHLSIVVLSLGILIGVLSTVLLVVLTRRWQRVLGKMTRSTLALRPDDNGRIKKGEPSRADRIRFKQPVLGSGDRR
jgi:hypothetical protein